MLVLRNNNFIEVNEKEVDTIGIDLTMQNNDSVYVELEELLDKEDTPILIEMIYACEFDILVDSQGKLYLKDFQNANLGDIEKECFENILDIVDRMEIYFNDYWGHE